LRRPLPNPRAKALLGATSIEPRAAPSLEHLGFTNQNERGETKMRSEAEETPSAADLDAIYGSKFLSGSDLGDSRLKLRIAKVRKEELRNKDGIEMKFVLYFDGSSRRLVLNKTNSRALARALGDAPANWIGASVSLRADHEVTFGGKPSLRLEVLTNTTKPGRNSPGPDDGLNDDITF
jgi:hypothetical protein